VEHGAHFLILYYPPLASRLPPQVQKAADDAMRERLALWEEIGRQRDASVAAAQATRDSELAAMRAEVETPHRHLSRPYSDHKVANRDIRIWRLVMRMTIE
jgi:hypothetical protein